MIIFLFFFIAPNLLSLYVYDSFHILDYLNKEKENESELKDIIKYISKTFLDAYAYNEIAKNPPQPQFDKNYHKKVDIQKLLNEINTTNISFYQFYQQINRKVSQLRDLHIDFQFNNRKIKILDDLYSISPIKFEIKEVNQTYKIFCKTNKYQIYFNKEIIEKIEKNKNNSIVSINNKDPFDFIANFCGKIGSTKNPHGTFTHKFNSHYEYNLGLFPLDINDLKYEIIFENGEKLNYNYIFASTYDITDFSDIKYENLKKESINDILFNEYVLSKKVESKTKKLSKLRKEFNEAMNISDIKSYNKISDISWNYIYFNNSKNFFKCRIDENYKINVYYIETFSPENYTLYQDTFLKCVKLFDQNNYPIIVILNNNDGGFADLPKFMIEIISPLNSVSKFMSKKVNDYMNKNKNLFDIDEIVEVNYNDNIKGNITKPVEDLTWLNDEIINHKKNLINKRKPTDILIFTDGYSFSAASTFIKYFQYYGAGIVTGYFGNPKQNNIPFDSGQSSSSIFDNQTLYSISPNGYKHLHDKYNITLKMPGNQNFFDDLNLNIPLEYLVTPVDERVKIFHHYKDSIYISFIEEAKKIFDKYKIKCNPRNKKLVYVTNKCDGKFENEYTHGGYECGDDGFWSNKCVPSYCDIEFVFNHLQKKCILKTKNISIIIYILIIALLFVIYRIIVLLFNVEENEDSAIELIDMSEKKLI